MVLPIADWMTGRFGPNRPHFALPGHRRLLVKTAPGADLV